MATIISTLFISLDGIAEADPDWHFPYFDENMAAAVTDDYAGTELLLLGRVTYDSFAGAWPDRETAGDVDADFAAQLGDTPKLVATRTRTDLGWRNAEPTDDLLSAVRGLRERPGLGKVLIPGSLSVVQQLLDAGELDELHLLVHPVAAQHGRRLFAEGPGIRPLKLLSSEVFPSGVIRLAYAPAELPGKAGYAQAAEKLAEAGSSE
ncbi:dihydrofolate reductase [Propionicimonas paludicola]|uniref:Dihydrofolate reductase n=1 Tax=Propionicimonas paludicola TaxID=185243 RepID=A0A2A9CMZ1_9ACTN|nr:dihydrofolate reductase family protein [Propionicimonas paludicola]PFG15698.1 dihydrofolate reductase [Propionicimonas paludicola]